MKRIFLYCLTVLLLSACIRENRDDCDALIRLYFTYEHSISDFDSKVANEVHLQIYQNNILIDTDIIPYEAIKGGKEYVLENYATGNYQLVAWAVPADDDDVCDIPEAAVGDDFSDGSLDLSRNLIYTNYYDPIGNIFLGEESATIVSDESSLHEVSLEPCICRVWFTVYNSDLLMETRATAQGPWIALSGTRSRMSIGRISGGEESTIYKDLTYDPSTATLVSGKMGVLPGSENQYLSVDFHMQDDRIARVNTTHRATAGDEIHITWTLGAELEVLVNGWRVKDATVTYF
ncbi:MAG: FimB/Mfa2 family fimbrial subunit [Tannerellaceae bacterium]|nr:FimB/Mfa2 family fimbrial subunit [Tannerellaceae bacterium]